jgi:hypothetical protein
MFNLKQGTFWSTFLFFTFVQFFCSIIKVQGNININNDMIVNLKLHEPKKNPNVRKCLLG